MKTTRKKQGAKQNRQRRFAEARGYLAKGSNLGELVLFESFIEQHCKEIKERVEYLERIAKGLARIRAEIKSNQAR